MIENDIDEFKRILLNNSFKDILRYGKWLIFELESHYLLSHLRMEGKYFIKSSSEPIAKHEHVIISFNDNSDLRYHDTRKFGRMKIIIKNELWNSKELKNQGLEPFNDKLDTKYLLTKFAHKKIPIKTALLDQSIICGLGNIYADEVLFASGINPNRSADSIKEDECHKIIMNSKQILLKAIEEGGTTIKSYTSSLGVTGNYQNFLRVHKRLNMECYNCKTKIKRIKIGGRSTYYCENCQK